MKAEKILSIQNYRTILLLIILPLVWALSGCKKDFLDKKPSKGLLVPTSESDFDALLDNNQIFNIGPELNERASGDLYITNDGWLSLQTPQEQNAYIFADDVYSGQSFINEWNIPYQQVFYANVVLDGLNQLKTGLNSIEYNRIKGTALFQRAFAFYNLVQLFSKPYNIASSLTDPGIPLRLKSDVNLKSVRGTVNQTYNQILTDLNTARSLLPMNSKFKSRPSQPAADALLARVYLSMSDYTNAEIFADSCLAHYTKLYDYNTLDSSSYSPFPQVLPDNGDEVIFYARLSGYSFEVNSNTFVDSALYKSYKTNDLRRVIFYTDNGSGMFNYKGTYEGNSYYFGGLATDEIYFIRAECLARKGRADLAMNELNTVLLPKWKTGTFVRFTTSDASVALNLVLQERRKELIARGLRWTDLRRLNNDPNFQVTIKHVINGKAHLLVPGDKHYTFPIPDYEIKTSGIPQN